ncbi:unnamed protein product [Macrosiphum euphorbiae]|uniref:Transposase n=1 Tax=Macrosiphum euphorbiae TaxID=13131 RepID=A0AAV0Y719_9HEMI|nr:unnamed protein product [Macrosiphum euphorbiae]
MSEMEENCNLDDPRPHVNISLPWPVYNSHFKVNKILNDNDYDLHKTFEVSCNHCVTRKTLTADSRSMSNLRKHLKLKHSHVKTVKELLMPNMNVSVNCIRKEIDGTDKHDTSIESNVKKIKFNTTQTSLKSFIRSKDNNISLVSQDTLNQMVQDLIINASLPFNLVSHENFKDIISKGFPGRNLMCRQTLMQNIDKSFNILFDKLKSKLNSVEHLTTTADAWSTFKRSYLGITVHWIEEGSLERKSYLLSIKRLTGSHTYDILARSMESVYTLFSINNKILYTTTDNGSNFVKSFKVFGAKDDDINALDELNDTQSDNKTAKMLYSTFIPDEVDDLDNCTIRNEDEDNDFQDISHFNIAEVFEETEDEVYMLPKHHRCAAHTLNLIATNDIRKAISGAKNAVSPLWKYKQQSRTTFAKLTNLWNKQNRSSKIADLIKICFGVYLLTPTETRWNSTYDSVKFFLKNSKSKSGQLFRLCDDIDIVRFNKNDIEFLEEYTQMMEPLAIVLDLLQGEKNMFFGFLIPSITELIYKYEQLFIKNQLKICFPLVEVIIKSIEKRFEKILSDQFLTIAAISHPYFKTVWIKNQVKKDLAISDFKKTVLDMFNANRNESTTDKPVVDNSEDEAEDSSFFSWSNVTIDKLQETSTISVENEVCLYLNRSPTKKLTSLNEFPNVKKVFIKHNTPLPSSGPIERVFSVSNAILTKRRGKMEDKTFEKAIFLKYNSSIM